MFPFYYDPYFFLVLIGMAISGMASMYMKSTFSKYSEVKAANQGTAAEICRIILDMNGLSHIRLEGIRGELTDHYSAEEKTLRLSESTKNSTSVAAIGVAAHEAGHALQDKEDYIPLRLRHLLVPVTNFGQTAALPVIIFGLLIGRESGSFLISLGIFLFSFALFFQLVTLPVEFNASRRAMDVLENSNLLNQQELKQAKKVLRAAALTYVAASITTFINLVRIFLITRNRRR